MNTFVDLCRNSQQSASVDVQALLELETTFFDVWSPNVYLLPLSGHLKHHSLLSSAFASRYWHLCKLYDFDDSHALERQYCLRMLSLNWPSQKITAYRNSFITSLEEYIKTENQPLSLIICCTLGVPRRDSHDLYRILNTEDIAKSFKKSVLSADPKLKLLSMGLLHELVVRENADSAAISFYREQLQRNSGKHL